jgi:hypothetical protein
MTPNEFFKDLADVLEKHNVVLEGTDEHLDDPSILVSFEDCYAELRGPWCHDRTRNQMPTLAYQPQSRR